MRQLDINVVELLSKCPVFGRVGVCLREGEGDGGDWGGNAHHPLFLEVIHPCSMGLETRRGGGGGGRVPLLGVLFRWFRMP